MRFSAPLSFFCDFHAGPDEPDAGESEGPSEMFRFIKVMEPPEEAATDL